MWQLVSRILIISKLVNLADNIAAPYVIDSSRVFCKKLVLNESVLLLCKHLFVLCRAIFRTSSVLLCIITTVITIFRNLEKVLSRSFSHEEMHKGLYNAEYKPQSKKGDSSHYT